MKNIKEIASSILLGAGLLSLTVTGVGLYESYKEHNSLEKKVEYILDSHPEKIKIFYNQMGKTFYISKSLDDLSIKDYKNFLKAYETGKSN